MNYFCKGNFILGQVVRYACLNNRKFSSPISKEIEDHGIKQIGVIGAGQMGFGIALVAAQIAQLPVKVLDSNPKQIEKGLSFVDGLLEKDVVKNRITREKATETKSRITTTTSISEFSSMSFIIEAIPEDVDLKREIFAKLDQITSDDTILATNTSSISITKIAAATKKPDKVIGMHFMNPVPIMRLVEIIPGLETSSYTCNVTKKLATSMGKTFTESQDVPGFIANRLLMPYINEAVIALEQGVASRDDIDTTMKLGTNVPMGPLTLADHIGLDTCLAIMKVLHKEIGDSKYRPAVFLQKLVDAGRLGKKSGKGFYEY
ncbi:18009_t:CDS:2 [Funneliformis geosporum]|nr:18009_t:CDS:2 [Funneliformis geosporum]